MTQRTPSLLPLKVSLRSTFQGSRGIIIKGLARFSLKRTGSAELNLFLFLNSHSFFISTLSKGEKREDEEARCFDGIVTATGLRDFSKRTADNAGSNEGGESAHRSEKSDVQVSV